MEQENFIDIQKLIKSKSPRLAKWLPRFIIRYLKRILHQDEINSFLRNHKHLHDQEFCQAVINYFNIEIEIKGIEHIPQNGKAIVAMNHPLGGMDAIAFVAALKNHRRDIRFIVNDILLNLENLKGLFVGVNKHGKNEKSVREQVTNLFASDNLVCIFPAGLVSRRKKGVVQDLEWKKTFVTYGKKFNHVIVPVHINGELSNFFYNLSNFRTAIGIKTNIEMLYLSDELFKQRNKKMVFTIGKPIEASKLNHETNDKILAQQIKENVYDLPKVTS